MGSCQSQSISSQTDLGHTKGPASPVKEEDVERRRKLTATSVSPSSTGRDSHVDLTSLEVKVIESGPSTSSEITVAPSYDTAIAYSDVPMAVENLENPAHDDAGVARPSEASDAGDFKELGEEAENPIRLERRPSLSFKLPWRSPSLQVVVGNLVAIKHQVPAGVALPVSDTTRDAKEFQKATSIFCKLTGRDESIVTQVDVYHSDLTIKNHANFRERLRMKGRESTDIWVYHGTSPSSVEQTMVEGFKLGGIDSCALVNRNGFSSQIGIYTSAGPKDGLLYRGKDQMAILALGLTGKIGTPAAGLMLKDSWQAPGNKDWIIFKSSHQLLPLYVVHYSD